MCIPLPNASPQLATPDPFMLNVSTPIDQLLQQALQHHLAGRLPPAESLYHQILAQQPNHSETLRLLGVLASQCNQPDTALQFLRQAIAIKPDVAAAWLDMGNALQTKAQLSEAIDAFQRAAALNPNFPAAFINLGNALQSAGR